MSRIRQFALPWYRLRQLSHIRLSLFHWSLFTILSSYYSGVFTKNKYFFIEFIKIHRRFVLKFASLYIIIIILYIIHELDLFTYNLRQEKIMKEDEMYSISPNRIILNCNWLTCANLPTLDRLGKCIVGELHLRMIISINLYIFCKYLVFTSMESDIEHIHIFM